MRRYCPAFALRLRYDCAAIALRLRCIFSRRLCVVLRWRRDCSTKINTKLCATARSRCAFDSKAFVLLRYSALLLCLRLRCACVYAAPCLHFFCDAHALCKCCTCATLRMRCAAPALCYGCAAIALRLRCVCAKFYAMVGLRLCSDCALLATTLRSRFAFNIERLQFRYACDCACDCAIDYTMIVLRLWLHYDCVAHVVALRFRCVSAAVVRALFAQRRRCYSIFYNSIYGVASQSRLAVTSF